MGGNDTNTENERNYYHVYKNYAATLKVNIKTGFVIRCADMHYGRQAQGICCIGNSIYVVGGLCDHEYLRHVERYDMLSDAWVVLPEAELPQDAFSMSLMPI